MIRKARLIGSPKRVKLWPPGSCLIIVPAVTATGVFVLPLLPLPSPVQQSMEGELKGRPGLWRQEVRGGSTPPISGGEGHENMHSTAVGGEGIHT